MFTLALPHRLVYFFYAGDWQTSTVANEFGLLDTSFWRRFLSAQDSLNVGVIQFHYMKRKPHMSIRTAAAMLDILRGIQGLGSAALIPASVRMLSTSSFRRLYSSAPSARDSSEGIPRGTFTSHRIFHFLGRCRHWRSLWQRFGGCPHAVDQVSPAHVIVFSRVWTFNSSSAIGPLGGRPCFCLRVSLPPS